MSSGSESDDDYVPGEPEVVSEEDSADEETETQYEQELEIKTNKRKAKQENKVKKKAKTKNLVKEAIAEEIKEDDDRVEEKLDPEEEKKREDDLWAKFLEGTDSKPKTTSKAPETTCNFKDSKAIIGSVSSDSKTQEKTKSNNSDNKDRERRIFEFAGETLVVENNIIKERIKVDSPGTAKTSEVSSLKTRTSGGGLSSVLEQLNKKNKLSTLEKSKLDWETYKKEEDIDEEIKNYNKGKNGYLERQDFLERADVRQFEIERDLRTSRRSSRLS